MARVLYGGVGLQGLSGSINTQAGGHTFSKNNVVRRRVVPTNPQTAAQSVIRANFSFLTTAWKGASEANKEAWLEARNGSDFLKQDLLTGTQRKYGSAKDLFIALNTNWALANDTLDAPDVNVPLPIKLNPSVVTVNDVAIDASGGTVAVSYGGTLTDTALILYATPPVSAGNMRAKSVESQMRVVGIVSGASPVAMGTAYTNLFGPITSAAGKKVFWKAVAIQATDSGISAFAGAGSSVIAA